MHTKEQVWSFTSRPSLAQIWSREKKTGDFVKILSLIQSKENQSDAGFQEFSFWSGQNNSDLSMQDSKKAMVSYLKKTTTTTTVSARNKNEQKFPFPPLKQ